MLESTRTKNPLRVRVIRHISEPNTALLRAKRRRTLLVCLGLSASGILLCINTFQRKCASILCIRRLTIS